MERLLLNICITSPSLGEEIDTAKVRLMIRLHDAGEILMGDLPPSVDDPRARQQKARGEPLAVTMLTQHLAEPVQSELRQLHHLYEVRSGKEALLTKWLDIVQGNDFALVYQLYETIPTRTEKAYHIRTRVRSSCILIN
jgi:5'-deoxynucleotidase YfbR-like HD superfamily hydrolase